MPKRPRDAAPEDDAMLFMCSAKDCMQSFASQWSLTRHLRTHTGETPYSCIECGKGFLQKCALDRHAATHSDQRPWSCIFCDKRFKQKEYLQLHKEKLHGDILADIQAFKKENPDADDIENQINRKIQNLTKERDDARNIAKTMTNRLLSAGFELEHHFLATINDF